jgi:hypothetical protein
LILAPIAFDTRARVVDIERSHVVVFAIVELLDIDGSVLVESKLIGKPLANSLTLFVVWQHTVAAKTAFVLHTLSKWLVFVHRHTFEHEPTCTALVGKSPWQQIRDRRLASSRQLFVVDDTIDTASLFSILLVCEPLLLVVFDDIVVFPEPVDVLSFLESWIANTLPHFFVDARVDEPICLASMIALESRLEQARQTDPDPNRDARASA